MSEDVMRSLGRVETKVDSLHADVLEIKAALPKIQDTQTRHDAIITTLLAIAAIVGVVLGAIALL